MRPIIGAWTKSGIARYTRLTLRLRAVAIDEPTSNAIALAAMLAA
jgi:hypothetical protein